ncbi:dTDP-4-dehydrorhamnose 3,5-epimerase [Aquidulcibacter paucihalophilus]|uniref:dTDP-4-dehydrorhamnose 3,5-epimerase n=1 Tax=Aquidulcibacter paucihalophilus TaxID=1978549 RepID=UPI000D095361|nr:dTDP-4-dehydrorhamnose 3,5-epimerase [Aquidulcibacter paucihalophilus]
MIEVRACDISDVLLIKPKRFIDQRGWFEESYSQTALLPWLSDLVFVQDNHVMTGPAGTIRGLHFQAPPHAQDKLIRCTRGAIYDVAVDIRLHSPTFGRWIGAELSAANGLQIFVPKGFAHGYLTLEDDTEVAYKVSSSYNPKAEGGVRYNDPWLNIAWPRIKDGDYLVHIRDQDWPLYPDFVTPFVPT